MAENRLLPYGIAATVFALDRVSKWLINTRVSFVDNFNVIPGFFDIVHSQNRGIAFGLFNDGSGALHTILLAGFSLLAVVVVGWMLWRPSRLDRLSMLGLALVLGGAAGNVFDRIAWGHVTDFLEFYVGEYHWPTFNLADSAIVVGSGLLLIALLRPKRQEART